MSTNTRKLSARNRRARRNLALKLQLENTFKREVKSYFFNLRKKLFGSYARTGDLPRESEFREDTISMLRKHYNRVYRAFGNEMRLFIEKSNQMNLQTKQDDVQDKIDRVVDQAAAIYIVNESINRAGLIDRTTINDANESIQQATQDIVESGGNVTTEAVSVIAAKKFRDKYNGRVDSVALTETQNSSEAFKEMEAAVVSVDGNADPVNVATAASIGNPDATKEWAAILDQVTREAHVIADGQTVPMSDPFVVDGELLRRPGDTSLGASSGNVINCRCSALYGI